MTSHLSVSYTSPPAAANTAASTVSSIAAAATSAPSDPLGFLGALIDQLLAGSAGTQTTGPTTTAPAPLGVPIPLPSSDAPSPGLTLLDKLAGQLGDLKDKLAKGETPSSDDLAALNETIDALTQLLNAPLADDSNSGQAAPGTGATSQGITPGLPPPIIAQIQAALPSDRAAALLRIVGMVPGTLMTGSGTPPTGPTVPTHHPTGTMVPPGIDPAAIATSRPTPVVEISRRLADLADTLTPADPTTGRKLAALANSLAAVRDTPTLLAQLDPHRSAQQVGGDPTGPTLTTIVNRLDGARPSGPQAGTPDLASPRLTPPALGSDAADPIKASVVATPVTPPVDAGNKSRPAPQPSAQAPVPDDARPPDDSPAADAPRSGPQQAAAPTLPGNGTHGPSRLLPAAYQPVSSPINMGHVAFEMVRQVHQGLTRFAIRLDPAELGRVDVRMNVDPSGGVSARLTVDRPETLDLFQRDQRTLERALQQAGLDTSRTTLEFSLRQNGNPFAGMSGGDQGRHSASPYSGVTTSGDDDAPTPPLITTLYRGTASAAGVNLFV